MTATLTSGISGHVASVQAFMLSLVTPDSDRATRIRDLVTELDDISVDRQMAGRMNPTSTRGWLHELAVEERATWRALRATALTQEEAA